MLISHTVTMLTQPGYIPKGYTYDPSFLSENVTDAIQKARGSLDPEVPAEDQPEPAFLKKYNK